MNDLNNTVAIVGMSLRFPKAATPAEFWRNLAQGRDCGRVLSKEELLKLGVSREKMDSPEYVFRSYDLDNIDQFDARFFGMSPREARMADPQMRLMLETAHECIEDSGHVLQGTNTGLYFGVADHKYWLYHNLYQSALEEENEVAKRIFAFKDFFATQVSHKLGLNGPSISLYSACSTGLLATHEACNTCCCMTVTTRWPVGARSCWARGTNTSRVAYRRGTVMSGPSTRTPPALSSAAVWASSCCGAWRTR
jgi:acyl transferase domain-containing protein